MGVLWLAIERRLNIPVWRLLQRDPRSLTGVGRHPVLALVLVLVAGHVLASNSSARRRSNRAAACGSRSGASVTLTGGDDFTTEDGIEVKRLAIVPSEAMVTVWRSMYVVIVLSSSKGVHRPSKGRANALGGMGGVSVGRSKGDRTRTKADGMGDRRAIERNKYRSKGDRRSLFHLI